MTTLSKCPICGKLIILSFSVQKGKSSIEHIKPEDLCKCQRDSSYFTITSNKKERFK
jgi:hypothetical protein